MEDAIKRRLNKLIKDGEFLSRQVNDSNGKIRYWVPEFMISKYEEWLVSSYNLISIIFNANSHYFVEATNIINYEPNRSGIPSTSIIKMFGLLSSLKNEIKYGLIKKIEYQIDALNFDNFLDHASIYHKSNKKIESSILASAVLEDTLKKICIKNGIDPQRLSLEDVINELVKNNVFTSVKGKRVKSYAGIRNHAFHAEWDKYDIKDVGELISGLRKLIEEYI